MLTTATVRVANNSSSNTNTSGSSNTVAAVSSGVNSNASASPRLSGSGGGGGGASGSGEMVGPFVLGPVLGRGCTGLVQLGTHRDNGFQVAFKIMSKKHLDSKPQLWQKVKREVAILKLIDHPNILKLYDVLETKNHLYLILEHVQGGELFDYIISKGRLARDEALRFCAQMVMGLEHCHAHSICHRDLKPENLLLDSKLNIKIGDFGMAQLMKGENNLLKTSCGSPHYASPEIIEGGTYDGTRTDVWSMGVILFALITGSLPFDDENLGCLLDLVRKGQYSTPSFVPKDIADLISKMLTVDPAKRIPIAHIKFHPCFQTVHLHPHSPSPPVLRLNAHCLVCAFDDDVVMIRVHISRRRFTTHRISVRCML